MTKELEKAMMTRARLKNIANKTNRQEDIDQSFPTTVPRHISVPRNDYWRAAKRFHF